MVSPTAPEPAADGLRLRRREPRNLRRIVADCIVGAVEVAAGAAIGYLAIRYGPEFAHAFRNSFEVYDGVAYGIREIIAHGPTVVGAGTGGLLISHGALRSANYEAIDIDPTINE